MTDEDPRVPGDPLRAAWLAEGADLRDGVSPEAIDEFEARTGVVLPADLRSFYLEVDGSTEEDNGHLSVFPLAQLRACGDLPPGWFVFAQFLIGSHEYAIHLSADATAPNLIVAVADGKTTPVAASFSEFAANWVATRDPFPQT